MRTKAWMTALLLAGAAAWSVPALAAEPAPAAQAAEAAAEELTALEKAGGVEGLPMGFLPAMELGDGASYHPMDIRGIDPSLTAAPCLGQLRITGDGITQTADVLNLETRDSQLDVLLSGLFGGEDGRTVTAEGVQKLPCVDQRQVVLTVTAEGVQKIAAFNHMLGNAGAMMNQSILEAIAQLRRETGEPMPYSILHTELRSVEALHLMAGTDGVPVYTTGSRVLVYVDGWLFPTYVKGYLWKADGSYRAVFLWCNDSQKDAVREAGDRLVLAAVGKAE